MEMPRSGGRGNSRGNGRLQLRDRKELSVGEDAIVAGAWGAGEKVQA